MTRACSNCNQLNPSDASFCLNCSSPLGPTVGGPAYQQQNQPYVGGQAPYVGAPPQQFGGGQNFGMQGSGTQGGASGRAIGSAILAVVTLVLCCGPFTGIPGAILGWVELEAIKKGQAPEAGRWLAQVGLWGGIAATVISSVITLFLLLFSAIPMGM